ncbi:aspartate carbamoyltransferase catalytic subunit [candidate division KSB1 bacterium]|nr:aspartate carbamoyltransferase catalytic subunit [candidate division KSB1 bacterium]RQW06768.1 MAG: aspartate carbamoyltransferase catalytic subunit [candidate division KSB1 bacterium]
MALSSSHLLGLEGVPAADITTILNTAENIKTIFDRPIPKVPTLRGITVVNLFFEASTRTRISFELAEKRLSADTVNFSTSTSSVKKGETLKDTVRNIEAMKINMIVVRHSAAGVPYFLTQCTDANIINAGDGQHEHPTQALLDMMTLREKWGQLAGKKVAIIGDVMHSRVAGSNIRGLLTMGAEVMVCGPRTLIPPGMTEFGANVSYSVDEAMQWADALNVLRIQHERQEKGLFPSIREYHAEFGITRERVERAKKELIIMHPGPINRGVEMDSDVADSDASIILEQVTNGVAVRMAVLVLLSGMDTANE